MSQKLNFWNGKRVFLTGHSGFKGSWLALWLCHMGAEVMGYSLDPNTTPNLYSELGIDKLVQDVRGDIRNSERLELAMGEFAPEVIFHLAAQPLVRLSYADPIETYEVNVLGTARLLNAVRRTPSVRAVVSVTTDKCYENKEWVWGYRESDPLGGYDPYSSSKACAEIVTAAFRQSYFPVDRINEHGVAIATARAGNVIGGGDWSKDRLIPDLIRGFGSGKPVPIRSPGSIRPWQHVVEPLNGYLKLAEKLMSREAAKFSSAYNFGPVEDDARPVEWIVDRMKRKWGEGASWYVDAGESVHEANYLKLDASRAHYDLGWRPQMNLAAALDSVIDWYKAHADGTDMHAFTRQQIIQYESLLCEAMQLNSVQENT